MTAHLDSVCLEDVSGHVVLDTRFVLTGRGIEGQGRSRRFDRHGLLLETTPWQSGVVVTMPEGEEFTPAVLAMIEADLR